MQLNAVSWLWRRAEPRIFDLMDAPSETDEGRVTLVNAKYQGDTLVEARGAHRALGLESRPAGGRQRVYTRSRRRAVLRRGLRV